MGMLILWDITWFKGAYFCLFSFMWNIDNILCEFRLMACITAQKTDLPLWKHFGLQDSKGFILQATPYASQNQSLLKNNCLENDIESYKLLNNTISALEILSFCPMINPESLTTAAYLCHIRIYGSISRRSSTFSSDSKNFEVGWWHTSCLREVGQFHIVPPHWYRILTKITFYIKL